METLKNLLDGASRVLILSGERNYLRPQGGFARDAAALRSDMGHVAKDLRGTLRKHGQQVDHGKR